MIKSLIINQNTLRIQVFTSWSVDPLKLCSM